jgi:hypothetical protein
MKDLIKKILLEYSLNEVRESKWNLENIRQIASQYQTPNDFKKNNYAAYQAAHKYGFWSEISKNFVPKSKSPTWTKEIVTKEAKKYETNRDFNKNSPRAYAAAVKYGWIEEIRKNFRPLGNRKMRMVYVYEFPDKSVYVGLTFDEKERKVGHTIKGSVFEYIKNTELKPIFKDVSLGYISVDKAQNLERCVIEDYRFKGWKILNRAKGGGLGSCERKWDINSVKTEAKKFSSYQDFYKNSPIASRVAYEQEFLDEIIAENGWKYLRHYWTKEEIEEIAKKYDYKYAFEINEPNAYVAAKNNGWFDDVTIHMQDRYKDWTKQMVQDLANKYNTVTEFAKNEPNAYSAALRNEWIEEIRINAGFDWKGGKKWTFDEIAQLAKKYPTRTQFNRVERTPYAYAFKRGWIDILFPEKFTQKYTDEEIINNSQSYKSRGDLQKNNINLYQRAYNRNLLDVIFPLPPKVNLDDDSIVKEISQYKSLADLRNNNKKLYDRIRHGGKLEFIRNFFQNSPL